MDTLKAIQVFVEVAKRQSFTQAAESLDLSRAMTSRYVDHLESVFKLRLLQRNTRKVSLTSAGEKALSHCYAILQQQENLANLSSDTAIQGTLRLTMGNFLFQIYLKDLLVSFSEHYPQVKFDLLITEDIVDLYDQRIDLAFRISQNFAEGLIAAPLAKVASVFCAAPQLIKKYGEINTPEQLLQIPCIHHQAAGKTGQWTFHQKDQVHSYPVQTAYHCNEVMVKQQLCLAGQGVAMLPTTVVQQDLDSGALIPVLKDYQAPLYELCMLYSSRLNVPKTMQLFMSFVKQYFAKTYPS